ncbi:hypothetical protein ONE63_010329 [Megalurothrips usitatus]|uniref:Retrovirus-related Pol polyprotein from transposon TNT 1-94-like beta-barrel domain-containing protein n=1 Tax=Megalurothrips usitatus TaxID=439358 RepID=A0AAV7XHI0_9NEOP|nr:hypothetical protein ONE63_010329 [Megalurothrips usitatus]
MAENASRIKAGDTSNVTVLKDNASYLMWSFEMDKLLSSKGLKKVVSGEVSIDDVVPGQQDLWLENDAQASVLIMTTCAPNVKQHLLTCNTSNEMYDKLKQIYEKDNEHQRCSLMEKLYAYVWDPTKNAMENVSSVQNLAYQLNCLDQPVNETAVITKITHILPEKYSNFVSAWNLLPAAEKSLNNLLASLQQEETKIASSAEETTINALRAERHKPYARPAGQARHYERNQQYKSGPSGHNRYPSGSESRRSNGPCKHCRKTNHASINCYFRSRYCSICNLTNHYQKDCRYREHKSTSSNKPHKREERKSPPRTTRRTERERECNLASQPKTVKSKIIKIDNRNKNVSKTPQEVALTADSSNSEKPSNRLKRQHVVEFVTDSGATAHMTNDLNIISNPKPTKTNIRIAEKGRSIPSTYMGTIKTSEIDLKSVYHVPELSRNLLSVGELTDLNLTVLFNKNEVKVVDTHFSVPEKQILLQGSRTDTGIYTVFLEVEDYEISMLSNVENNLIKWHRKLGHLSLSKMKKLPNLCDGMTLNMGNQNFDMVSTTKWNSRKDEQITARKHQSSHLRHRSRTISVGRSPKNRHIPVQQKTNNNCQ